MTRLPAGRIEASVFPHYSTLTPKLSCPKCGEADASIVAARELRGLFRCFKRDCQQDYFALLLHPRPATVHAQLERFVAAPAPAIVVSWWKLPASLPTDTYWALPLKPHEAQPLRGLDFAAMLGVATLTLRAFPDPRLLPDPAAFGGLR